MPRERGGVPPETGPGELVSVPAPGAGGRPWAGPLATDPASARAAPEPAIRAAGRAPGIARADPVAWLIALAAFAVYITISVFKYLRLDPGSWDLAIYTQYVQQIAYLHAPVVTIRGAGFNLLGDHFQPIVGLVAPFFRVFSSPVTLLVAQALLTAVSVVPVCRAAQALLGTGVSRAIGAAYGFSWGLQQMIIFDFHEIVFAVPLLAFSLSALVRRRPRAAVAWALPLVFVKEDQGLTVAAIGLLMVAMAVTARAREGRDGLSAPRPPGAGAAGAGAAVAGAGDGPGDAARVAGSAWAWAGVLLVCWGLAWSLLAIAVIIPHFNPAHHYPYWSDGGVISPGAGHVSAGGLLAQFTRAGPEKLRTTAMVLLPVAFVALRSPLAAVAVPGLALRFLSTNSNFWGTHWHYNATLMPIVFLAAIDGLARIQASSARRQARETRGQPRGMRGQAWPARRLAWGTRGQAWGTRGQAWGTPGPARAVAWYAAVVMTAVAAVLAFRFPLADLWNPQTYVISPHVRAEREAIARVPAGTTVEATLTLLAPLVTRDATFWIGTAGNPVPRYIVFDAANSGYSQPPTDVPGFLDQRYPGVTYQKIFEASDVYVFRRAADTNG